MTCAPLRSAYWTCLPMARLGFMYASVRMPAARSSLARASDAPCVPSSKTDTSTCTTVPVISGGYRFSRSIRSMMRSMPRLEPVVGMLSLRNRPISPS